MNKLKEDEKRRIAKITISMTEEEMLMIKEYAKENSINISSMTINLWNNYIKKNKEKK